MSVLQIPVSYGLRRPTEESWGWKLTTPVSFGFYDFRFKQLVNDEEPKSLDTVSVFPGIEGDAPVTKNWRLKAYGNVARGWDLSGGPDAWLYACGLKSLVGFPMGKDFELSLGNQLTLGGFRQDGGSNQPMGLFVAGLNLEARTEARVQDRPLIVGGHLIYYYYFKRLQFPTAGDVHNEIKGQVEIAMSLSVKEPIDLKPFELHRTGLGFRFGGGVRGVSLFFSLPYRGKPPLWEAHKTCAPTLLAGLQKRRSAT